MHRCVRFLESVCGLLCAWCVDHARALRDANSEAPSTTLLRTSAPEELEDVNKKEMFETQIFLLRMFLRMFACRVDLGRPCGVAHCDGSRLQGKTFQNWNACIIAETVSFVGEPQKEVRRARCGVSRRGIVAKSASSPQTV